MDKKKFAELMSEFQRRYDENEMMLDKVYDVIGGDLVELMCQNSYLDFTIKVISQFFKNDVKDDLEYLIYDCGFNLDVYCERVTVDNRRVILTTFEDYYDYLNGDIYYADI